MRICLYTNTALPCVGGQEHVVDELARRFQALRHEVVVLCPAPPHRLKPRDHELPYPVVRHPRFVSTRWFVNWYLTALRKLHQRYRYDVIHCHNIYPSGYLAALDKLRGGPPFVITSHGSDTRLDNPRFRKPGLRERHRLAVRQADRIVSISPFTQQGFVALGATPEQLVTIPNGVDAEQYHRPAPRPTSMPEHVCPQQYVLFLGRLVNLKGVDVLVRALGHWHATLPAKAPPHVVIAGDGAERENLEALRAELRLERLVTFAGHTRGPEKIWLLQNAFALAIPSREREAFPLVLLEGFASGCAVVASDAPGLRDLVKPHQTGWVVPRGDPAALARTLQPLWEHPATTEHVRQQARQVARDCDWDQVIARHLDVYEQVLRRSHSRQAA